MEELLRDVANNIGLAAELACIACIAVGAIGAVVRVAMAIAQRRTTDHSTRKSIWMAFAGWIILALEFALAADIVQTAIAPTWDDIGHLAAIAAIRTALNWFLERDLEAMREPEEASARASGRPA